MSSATATPALPEQSPKLTRGQWMVLLAAFLGWLFDGFEIGLFPVIARPALRDLLGGAGDTMVGPWMSYITAAFLLGAAAGGIIFGWLGDRIGRVRALSLSILVYSVFTGFGYFATAPWHLAGYRFIAALGMGGEWALGVALVMECWPGKWRPLLAGAIGAAANCGILLVAVIARYLQITPDNWRQMFLIGAAPAVLVFLIRLFVPESERWQHSVATSTTKVNPLKEVFGPALRFKTCLAIVLASVALIGTWGSVQWIPLWANKLVAEREMASIKAAHPEWYQTDAAALSPEWAAEKKRLEQAAQRTAGSHSSDAQILSGLGAIVGSLIAPLIGAMLGRRIAYAILCAASLVLAQILFRAIDEFGAGLLVLTFCVGAATASFYGWFPLYFPELFPTRVRATGQGLSYNAGRVLAAGGAVLQGQLVASFDGSYAKAGAIVTLVYVIGIVAIYFGPETNGKPLPD